MSKSLKRVFKGKVKISGESQTAFDALFGFFNLFIALINRFDFGVGDLGFFSEKMDFIPDCQLATGYLTTGNFDRALEILSTTASSSLLFSTAKSRYRLW